MNSHPTHLMARASIAIEQQPHRLTKTQLVKRIGGKRRRALEAVDLLCSQGYATTRAGPGGWPVYHNLKRYPDEGTDAGTGLPLPAATGGVPDGNGSAPAPTASPGSGKSSEVQLTANGGELFREARCRICRHPQVLQYVNSLLNSGFTITATVDNLSGINAGLPARSQITKHCVAVHRERHYNKQQPMAAAYRRVLEELAVEGGQEGSTNILGPAAFFQCVMAKSYAQLAADGAEVSIGEGLAAGRELSRLLAQGDDSARFARQQAQLNKIIEAFRTLPAPYQQQVLDICDGRTPPWAGGARPALVADAVDDDEPDPFDDDAAFDDDDE